MTIHTLIISGSDQLRMPNETAPNFIDVEMSLESLGSAEKDITHLANAKANDPFTLRPYAILGRPTKTTISEVIKRDVSKMSRRDAYVLILDAHGNAMNTNKGVESYVGLGEGENLFPSELEELLAPLGSHHQLVLVNACRDYSFGKIANKQRVVVTATSTLRACTHSLLSKRTRIMFFDALEEGSTYQDAYRAAVESVMPMIENPPQLLQEKMSDWTDLEQRRESLPQIHGPKSALEHHLIYHSPFEIQKRYWERTARETSTRLFGTVMNYLAQPTIR